MTSSGYFGVEMSYLILLINLPNMEISSFVSTGIKRKEYNLEHKLEFYGRISPQLVCYISSLLCRNALKVETSWLMCPMKS